MRKNLLFCYLILSAASFDVSAFEINVAEPGTFRELMIDTEEDVSTLTVNGIMNAADVEYLTGNTGKIAQVQHLIIGDLKLVESETEPYRSFTIFAEAGSGQSAKFYYSSNERTEYNSFSSGLGGSSVVYSIYSTDMAGLLAKTQFPKITLPADADKVPDYMCFECFETEEVVMSDNVEEIGCQAFMHDTKLTSINYPSKLKVIGECAFEWTGLTAFVLPDHPVEIRDRAFRISDFLESINLENVTSVGVDAFSSTRLKTVDLSGASVIGGNAFNGCPITQLTVSDKLRVIGERAFASPYSGQYGDVYMTDLVLYEGLESIGAEAFYDTHLKKVNIPSSVTYIGENAFGKTAWDSSLNTEAVDGVVYLGNIAYKSVNRPENIVFRDGTVSVSANFNMQYTKSFTLPSSVRSIYACAGDYQNLESAVLNEGLLIIGDHVFEDCPKLKEITLPSTLEYIGSGAFYNAGITSIVFPESLKVIKGEASVYNYYTFGSSKITSLTLPYGLEELGSYTFVDCKSLSTVRLRSRNLNYTGYSVDQYQHYSGGFLLNSGVEKIVIGAEVESIPSGLFGGVYGLAKVEFEESEIPLSIGHYALGSVDYYNPAKVTGSIDRVTSIGEWSLENLAFPYGTHLEMPHMKSLGKCSFNNIHGVTSMTFNKDLAITQADVVNEMPDLRIVRYDVPNVSIPKPFYTSSTSLMNLSNPLDSLIIGPNVEVIGEQLFYNVSARNIIFTPRNNTRAASTLSIGNNAFGYNTVLTCIDFPSDLISLGDKALREIVNLSTVYFHGDVSPIVGDRAIPAKATVYVPAASEQDYMVNMPENNVVPYKLESVVFDKSALALTPGESDYLVPRIDPAECSEMGVVWSSSDPSIATVSERGDVVGISFGQATITVAIAMDPAFKADCIVTVYDPNGVDTIDAENASPIEDFYTLDGIKVEKPTRSGIYIAKHADGSISKIMIK